MVVLEGPENRAGRAARARTLLTALGLGLVFALVLDLFVMSPIRTVGSVDGFYGPLDSTRRTSIALIAVVWIAVSGAAIAWHAYRLAAARTWSWSFEFSPWRVARSLFFIVGLVCLGSAVPGVTLSAAPVVTNSSETSGREWDLLGLVLAAGGIAMSAAIVMYVVSAIVVVARDIRALTARN